MFESKDTPGKQALDRFLDINNTDRQYEILRRLMVTSPEDEKREDFTFTLQMALRKIADEGKQAEFWRTMNDVCGEFYENPFDYQDMLSAIESPSNVKQNIHCPQCGRLWRIRSEHAVAVCKYGRCVKCLIEEKVHFDADAIRIYSGGMNDYDVRRGMKSRKQVELEQDEAIMNQFRMFRAAGLDDRSKRQRLDEAAAVVGYRPADLDALVSPEVPMNRMDAVPANQAASGGCGLWLVHPGLGGSFLEAQR